MNRPRPSLLLTRRTRIIVLPVLVPVDTHTCMEHQLEALRHHASSHHVTSYLFKLSETMTWLESCEPLQSLASLDSHAISNDFSNSIVIRRVSNNGAVLLCARTSSSLHIPQWRKAIYRRTDYVNSSHIVALVRTVIQIHRGNLPF